MVKRGNRHYKSIIRESRLEEKIKKLQLMTLLYSSKTNNNNAALLSDKGKKFVFSPKQNEGLIVRASSLNKSKWVDLKEKIEKRKEKIKKFYENELRRKNHIKCSYAGPRTSFETSPKNSLIENKGSEVSLKLLDRRESASIGFLEFNASKINDKSSASLTTNRRHKKKVVLDFSSNPIYQKFKKINNPENENLKMFKSSMLDVMSQFNGIKDENNGYTSRFLPKMDRLSKSQAQSFKVLEKKFKEKHIQY